MRGLARWLLLLFAFTIPWEYSLDLGAPLGNIARITGLGLLVIAGLAALQGGRLRRPGALQWLTLALYLWFCCSYLWSVAPEVTGAKLRGYFQEMMLVWLVWEFLETARDLRNLMRAWIAGSWVLAILTIANFVFGDPGSTEQIRFVAAGQDPNDVARFIDLGLPIAAVLLDGKEKWPWRILAAVYIPIGFACVLLTASRSGFLVGMIALAGCAVVLFQRNPRALLGGSLLVPALAALVWVAAPHETLLRLGSIAEQLQNGDLNQRVNIWSAGWRSFLGAPFCGHGAGSFVIAARLAPVDTAHNTVLSIVVEGGLCALLFATAIVAFAMRALFATTGALRTALFTLMTVWLVSSLVGTVSENRTTWLLLAMIALSCRLAEADPQGMDLAFPGPVRFEAVEPAADFQ
jgi:O-antigen ligase